MVEHTKQGNGQALGRLAPMQFAITPSDNITWEAATGLTIRSRAFSLLTQPRKYRRAATSQLSVGPDAIIPSLATRHVARYTNCNVLLLLQASFSSANETLL